MKKPVRNRFTEAYEKEVTPARIRKFHQDLAKLKTCPEKLTFARNEKVKYLQYISAETLDVSGSTAFPNFQKGEPLFFDRIIQLEIDKLEAECGKAKQAQRPEYTHRVKILAHQTEYKVNKELKWKEPKEWKHELKGRAAQAFYSLNERSKRFKAPTPEEWRKASELLKHCPEGQKIAINNAEK